MNKLRSSPAFDTYTIEQQRILDRAILAATLSGVALNDNDRHRCNEINIRLKELSNLFSDNVMDSIKAYSRVIYDKAELDGVPSSTMALLAQNAVAAGLEAATATDGPWQLSLASSDVLPVLKFCNNRRVRELIFVAHKHRAASPPFDNTPVIQEMLQLRHELAQLLGFASFAELSLQDKMAPSVDAIEDMIHDLRDKFQPLGKAELDDMAAFAAQHGQQDRIEQWDVHYWTEKLRQQRYQVDDELVKEYFPVTKVLDGLFELLNRLFGLRIEAADGLEETWHPDVRFFHIRDADQPDEPVVAQFFIDPYARPETKRHGTWMEVVVSRSKVLRTEKARARLPVFGLMLSQTPRVGNFPEVLPFDAVVDLVHAMGYGLRIALSEADYTAASHPHGVEWDAVETPAELMQNFCFHRETLKLLSGHFETGETLPDHLFDKLVAARQFMGATSMLRQLQLTAFDMTLYHRYDPFAAPRSVFELYRHLAKEYQILPPLDDDKHACAFSHIFPGQYVAAYYSYIWSQVMSSDAYSRFEEAKDEAAWRAAGRDARSSVFAKWGCQHPLEVFKMFRGRPPSSDALLRGYGLQ